MGGGYGGLKSIHVRKDEIRGERTAEQLAKTEGVEGEGWRCKTL